MGRKAILPTPASLAPAILAGVGPVIRTSLHLRVGRVRRSWRLVAPTLLHDFLRAEDSFIRIPTARLFFPEHVITRIGFFGVTVMNDVTSHGSVFLKKLT